MKIFNDPIHGHIELHLLLVKMIDTPQFQRLRHIKQLGSKYLVYPGATHTRFEHSIGVAYLARCLVESLQENQPELNITEEDSLCVQIAALCHDMGHGPFSHLFDGMFIPEVRPGKWKHEEASVEMFKHMIEKNNLKKAMKESGLNPDEDIIFIGQLIRKEPRETVLKFKVFSIFQRSAEKAFLYEIVANKVNGIDVDKWDYLARDCYYLGIPNGFDHQRLLKSARVCKVNGEKQICFRDKVADNVYGMFHTRYTLHRQALQHKIGYIIDVKITEVLKEADDMLKISDALFDMEKYTNLTDHIFDQILNHSSPKLKEAQKILEGITNRHLPKFIGEARLNEDTLKVTSHKQSKLYEWFVRVYYKKTDQDVQQRAKECFQQWCEEVNFTDSGTFSNHIFDKILKMADKRQLKFIGEAQLKEDKIKEELKEKIVNECNEKRTSGSSALDDKDFDIYILDMGFGEVGKEPIENVHFYNKYNRDTAFKIEKNQVSSLKPKKFHEWLIRVYYKKTYQNDERIEQHQKEVQQIAEESFQNWCKESDFVDSSGVSDIFAGEGTSSSSRVVAAPATDKNADKETLSGKIFNDPIHGHIELHPLLVKIIDTPQFQRLRHIKQLGGTYLVYPGATHTRFEHSLG
ncbi:deoxynucleoside triphosphate triphosphohydrolase SAMHD1-like [Chanodichthys erythropterus]|uniref:deoxynucleoside triphosphate triphosphohydrolase SAMHD1-like n=1 Tax=Chanodichthys erythropterus TaxID=933992 RepID=UPI00351DFDE1